MFVSDRCSRDLTTKFGVILTKAAVVIAAVVCGNLHVYWSNVGVLGAGPICRRGSFLALDDSVFGWSKHGVWVLTPIASLLTVVV